jgi:hypothetical protein
MGNGWPDWMWMGHFEPLRGRSMIRYAQDHETDMGKTGYLADQIDGK